MCKSRTTFYLLWLAGARGLVFYGNGLAYLPSWLRMVNGGWLGSMQSKIFANEILSLFKAVPLNRLLFYLGGPLHTISSLFSHFYLFQNAIFHKMLIQGHFSEMIKLIFLRVHFSVVAIFFFLFLVICLSLYLHLKACIHYFSSFSYF